MSDSASNRGRKLVAALILSGLAGVVGALVAIQRPAAGLRVIKGYAPWSQATLAVGETLPIQDGGRIKPLATYAGFNMLAIHGARTMKVAGNDGKPRQLTPTAWLLDTLFRPEFAIQHPTFRVDNSAVIDAIGLKPRAKRDRYSYQDLQPGLEKLTELAAAYDPLDPKQRDPSQQQLLDLACNVRNYESLLGHLTFARGGLVIGNEPGRQRLDISIVMAKAAKIRDDIAKDKGGGGSNTGPAAYLFRESAAVAGLALQGMNIFPPADGTGRTWQNAGNTIMDVLTGATPAPAPAISDIKALETTTHALTTSEAEFLTQLTTLRDGLVQRAAARGEGRHLALEVSYDRCDWFLNAFILFFIGTLSALAMGLTGGSRAGRIWSRVTLGWTVLGLMLCVIAMVERSVIMRRAPVGNLYDTIIFTSAAAVLLALVIEGFTRRRFALGLAPILGGVFIFLARRYELGDPKDSMDPLVAVLASNFWLTLHVITITLGYAAGLLCAFLSTCYILLRGLRLDRGDGALRTALTQAADGLTGLTLLLSLVGTVLGGIWANDSWGRFWGWDPKENGALLIVIWSLVILHARAAGGLKEWGLHCASAFTSCIVVFSWWHVNFLGIGLHNYGFIAGKQAVWAFYLAMFLIILFGGIAKICEPDEKQPNPNIHPR